MTEFDAEDENAGDRHFVTSLQRGLRVITAYRPDDRALTNQALAERTGLPRSTVARFTHTLHKLGYLVHHARSAGYSLAPRVIELSRAALVSTGINELARPSMEALSELGPFSVALGVASDGGIRYLDLARRPEAIVLNLDVGALVPVLQTAIGRAYLSALSEVRRAAMLRQLKAADPALYDAQAPLLAAEMERYQSEGYVTSFGCWWPELNAAATTIRFAEDGDPLLLSISGLSSALTPEKVRGEYAAALMNAARVIEGRMRRRYSE
ncbi:helix-turn-helix domain-containing protein [Martelella lutilitoris]|uniref:Helix-turn-helix domain-containing protein n=1 Tax=Martelella lutilitoris TaxID=2583532 RepID=A0A7T7HJ02_9HYPH|nr:helix-turn-helix domain-containing protein [Martelella lutilitoris]QQM29998.1 helix-turn-helix domain-containing protein [Martelella lutilitoris]